MLMRRRELGSGVKGAVIAALFAVLWVFSPASITDRFNYAIIDTIASLRPPPDTDRVLVVDIDSESLAEIGGRRISRARFADLIETIGKSGASSIGLDLVLGEPCDPSDPDVQRLTRALRETPVSMGFLLSDKTGGAPPAANTMVLERSLEVPDLWIANGADASCSVYLDAAAGNSTLSLTGGFDGRIRSVPVAVGIAGAGYASLPVDTLRLTLPPTAIFLLGNPNEIRLGDRHARIDRSGSLRPRFATSQQRSDRTVSAADVLNGAIESDVFSDRIVFIGSSAPELGGLRPVPGDPLMPSVQIHADAVASIVTGSSLYVPGWAKAATLFVAIALGVVMAFYCSTVRPIAVPAVVVLLIAIWLATCAFLFHVFNIIVWPTLPLVTVIAGSVAGAAFEYSAVRAAETLIRNRFEQRMPAALVSKLVNEPDLLKLRGERRLATSLISDLEDFSGFSERTTPEQLIDILDRYFAGLTRIIIAHGGMVDKTTGDGVHAIFNAPLELERHADAALDCATQIISFSESFRKTSPAIDHGLGRTRIGIESGEVVLGDVGDTDRVDYAAFGSSINMAARLEQANKMFKTSILVGERARSLMPERDLIDLGETELRGIGAMHVFTPSNGQKRPPSPDQSPTLA
ncbi:adenylate/guanylate cyclase domain-containing protein [Hoeflea sp. WL0058]|uniref:Adenylate/guanylate cyclase domain-containing protein n=1 Tax=Flavimaribacter sediminis TaxID=2865987 RepID=A0AAE2ZFK9_9HYPH|nr:adenylate/guanylate cyclase domain-containing protein [Flavimaribacter sediminis]MBW8635629.1 adenylate/guanylate cyclase domain-containing protein [Flavimaribacter sediminis]